MMSPISSCLETMVMTSLKEGRQYKFLGVPESLLQEERLTRNCAVKVYLQRMSVIWSSPLSDYNRVIASNQFSLPLLSYLVWTQHWPITEMKKVYREARTIIVENGGKHPCGSTALLYLPREKGGRGLRSVENEYKTIKIKAAVNLYENPDPTMQIMLEFEERSAALGYQSLVKKATKYAEQIDLTIQINHPNPSCYDANGKLIPAGEVKVKIKKCLETQVCSLIRDQKWQGKLITKRWDDEDLSKKGCFS